MNVIIPPGTVIAFAGTIDPKTYMCGEYCYGPGPRNNTGWILCDGSSVMQSLFPHLFRVTGYLYGGGAGTFNIPDYRGYFLRGLAVNIEQDPGYEDRIAAKNGIAGGCGSTQPCMVQIHEHAYTDYTIKPALAGTSGAASQVTDSPAFTTGLYIDNESNPLTGEETRPKNIYVNYIIYAG